MNPVSSEQHMHYIHLVIKEQHCSGECLHRRLCHNHLMHLPFALGLQPTHLLRCLLLPVWEDCLLTVAIVYPVIYLYTSATELHPKCGVTLHMPQYRKVFQARNKSNSDCYNRLYMSQQTVHVHTLYLLWGSDDSTLKVFHLTEPQEQPRQHIHWNMPQSNMLNTSVNVCRHWVGKQE